MNVADLTTHYAPSQLHILYMYRFQDSVTGTVITPYMKISFKRG